MQELRIVIGAETKNLETALKKAKGDLAKFEASATKGATGVAKLGKSTSNAVPALTSFSQVVQDAPFGIRGVANNITQLTSQMGYLSKSAGGTKAALKAMLGTLAGPAGILLAVSAVTSLLVAFGDKLKFSKDKAAEAKAALDKFNTSLKDYEDSLVGVQKAQLKGAQSAAKELTNLTLLKAQLDNTNLSQSKRLEAYNELQKKYPKYLGNVTKEDALVGGLDDEYDKLSTAILKSAKAKAAQALITENQIKVLNLESQIETNNAAIRKARAKQSIEESKAQRQANNATSKTWLDLGNQVNNYADEAKEGEEANVKLRESIAKINNESAQLIAKIGELGGALTTDFKVDTTKIAAPFDLLAMQNQRTKDLLAKNPPVIPVDNMFADANGKLQSSFLSMFGIVGNGVKKLSKVYGTALSEMEIRTLELSNFTAEIGSTISSGIVGIGESIGQALASGGNIINALGSSLLQAVGQIAIELGKQAIAIGVGMIAIKKAFSNPFTAIAAGAALVAIGSAIKATANTVGQVGGGVSSGVGGSGSTNSFGSSFSSSSGGFNGGRVVFEIAGDKLIGVLNNTSLGNLRVGDSDQLITTG